MEKELFDSIESYIKIINIDELKDLDTLTKNILNLLKKIQLNYEDYYVSEPHEIENKQQLFCRLSVYLARIYNNISYEDIYNYIDNIFYLMYLIGKLNYLSTTFILKINHNSPVNAYLHSIKETIKEIQPDKPLQYIVYKNNNKPQYRLNLCSRHISNRLVELGCGNNKTFNVIFPKNLISSELLHHFVRGYFDGDGCISLYKTKENYIKCYFSIIGCFKFIDELDNYLNDQLAFTKTKYIIRFPERDNNIV